MLGEDPGELVSSTIESFETDPDLASLARINDTMAQTEAIRTAKLDALTKEITELEAKLAERKKEVESLNMQSDSFLETLNTLGNTKVGRDEGVFKAMNSKSSELDSLKVSLAKQLSDLESTINQMHMSKISLSKQRDELAEQKEHALANTVVENRNSSTMKISLYRSLGLHIEPGKDSENDRVLVFNKETNLTSVLELDEKYSDYFISNYIWDRLGRP